MGLTSRGRCFADYDGGVARHQNAAPQLRHGDGTELLAHPELCETKTLSYIRSGRQLPIELPHQTQAEDIVGVPEIGDDRPGTRRQEWSYEARDSLLPVHGACPGVTRRQRDQVCIQLDVEYLSRLKQAVFAACRPQLRLSTKSGPL